MKLSSLIHSHFCLSQLKAYNKTSLLTKKLLNAWSTNMRSM